MDTERERKRKKDDEGERPREWEGQKEDEMGKGFMNEGRKGEKQRERKRMSERGKVQAKRMTPEKSVSFRSPRGFLEMESG